MIATIRCAACGSPRVKIDQHSEGYSLAKGLAGAFMFGAVGAVAGINGKKKNYYHCPDCGVTLSYPMGDVITSMISSAISSPDLELILGNENDCRIY